MNFKNEKGSITVFVLVGLLFMSSFLIISYGNNLGKSKIVKEQTDIVADIYASDTNIIESYDQAYADLRSKNKQRLTYDSAEKGLDSVSKIKFNKTYAEKISNFKIYGNSIQEGNPTPDTPVEIKSVGIYDADKDAYLIPIKISNSEEEKIYNIYLDEPLRKIGNAVDYIDFEEKRVYRNVRSFYLKVSEMDNGDGINDSNYPGWQKREILVEDFGTGVNSWINAKVTIWSNIFDKNTTRIGVNTINPSSAVIFFYNGNPPGLTQNEWKSKYGDLVVNICYAKPETIEELIELPDLNTLEDDTRIEILTEAPPTRVVLEYTGYKLGATDVEEEETDNQINGAYTKLLYIENTGEQYINTLYKPNSNTSIEIKFSDFADGDESDSANVPCVYCSREDNKVNTYTAFVNKGISLRVDYYNTYYLSLYSTNSTETVILKQDKNEVYVNNTLVKTMAEAEFIGDSNLYLMASHIKEGSIKNIPKCKLYYCRIWDNGTLVRDLVPCYRNYDNKVGLYDMVGNKFYINSGTGDFLSGAEE